MFAIHQTWIKGVAERVIHRFKSVRLSEFAETWLQTKATQKPKTFATYRSDLKHVLARFGQQPIGSVRRDQIQPPDGPGAASETDRRTYCRNQWWNPLKWNVGSNLVDLGRSAAHTHMGDFEVGLGFVGSVATTKACGVVVSPPALRSPNVARTTKPSLRVRGCLRW